MVSAQTVSWRHPTWNKNKYFKNSFMYRQTLSGASRWRHNSISICLCTTCRYRTRRRRRRRRQATSDLAVDTAGRRNRSERQSGDDRDLELRRARSEEATLHWERRRRQTSATATSPYGLFCSLSPLHIVNALSVVSTVRLLVFYFILLILAVSICRLLLDNFTWA